MLLISFVMWRVLHRQEPFESDGPWWARQWKGNINFVQQQQLLLLLLLLSRRVLVFQRIHVRVSVIQRIHVMQLVIRGFGRFSVFLQRCFWWFYQWTVTNADVLSIYIVFYIEFCKTFYRECGKGRKKIHNSGKTFLIRSLFSVKQILP